VLASCANIPLLEDSIQLSNSIISVH